VSIAIELLQISKLVVLWIVFIYVFCLTYYLLDIQDFIFLLPVFTKQVFRLFNSLC